MRFIYLNLAAQFERLLRSEDGQDLIEYALLAVLIATGAVLTIGTVGAGVLPAFSNVAQMLTKALASATGS